jgi:hypothetical protein
VHAELLIAGNLCLIRRGLCAQKSGMKRPYDLVTNTWRQSFTCDNYCSDGNLMLATLIFCAGMCRTELHRQCRTHVRVVRPRMACAERQLKDGTL